MPGRARAVAASAVRPRNLSSCSRCSPWAAALLCGAIGFGLANQSDERLWAEQTRRALAAQRGVGEFRDLFDEIERRCGRSAFHPDGRRQSIGAQRTSNSKPIPRPGEREMQPVMDAQGRIAGFLTWETDVADDAGDRQAGDAVHRRRIAFVPGRLRRSFPLLAVAPRTAQLRRAVEQQARRAAEEDALPPGCPNRRKMLVLLAGGEWQCEHRTEGADLRFV